MASSIRQKLAALVISLAFLVISLPVTTHALLPEPGPNPNGILVITDGIRTPAGVALDASDGSIFVTDTGRQGVIKFNKFGVPVMFFNTPGVPQRVAVARNGNGSVIVAQGGIVAQYNNNGVETFKLRQGTEPYPFKLATGVAVHPANGNIYVVDAGANKACVFDSTGNFTNLCFGENDWFEKDPKDSTKLIATKLYLPTDIQITTETTAGGEVNRVYIVDPKHAEHQVVVFSDAGIYQKSLCQQGVGAPSSGLCQLTLPMGITFDYYEGETGRVYVSDPYQGAVMAIDPAAVPNLTGRYGNFLRYIGSYGADKGQLIVPTGVAFDRQNSRLIVANGYGNLTFYAIDAGRNPINRDFLSPIFDIDYISANNVSNPTFILTGTRVPEDEVKVYVSVDTGAKAGETTYPTPSTWRCTITGLVEGRNVITAVGTDPGGNSLKKSVDLYFTRPVAGGVVVDPYPPITADSTFTFTGTITSGASVTTNPPAVGGCTYPTSTTWTCPVPLGTEGTNTVSFIVGETTTIKTIVKDSLAPSLQLYALGSGDTTTSQVQNIMGVVDDPNLESVTVKVNGSAAQPVDVTKNVFGFAATKGILNFPVLLDRAGANTVLIEAKDKVGNIVTDNRTISLNMAAPAISITTEDGKVTKQASLTITGSVVPSSATCTINGATADISSANTPLTQGFNNIVVACSDGVRTSKVKRTIYLDPNTLEVAVASPNQDMATKQTSVTLTGAVDTAADILIATIGGETHAVPFNDGQFSLTTPILEEGAHSILLTAVDGVGNVTSATTRSVFADTTPPALAITYGQTTASSVAGTVEPGATVVVKNFSDQTVGTITLGDDAAGNGTFSAALGQNYDLFSLVVAATDQAGNVTTIAAAKPDGDCTGNGSVSADDASICLDMVAGIRPPAMIERAHCDVGPLNNDIISPNGEIDITDCILVMRKAAGLPPAWW